MTYAKQFLQIANKYSKRNKKKEELPEVKFRYLTYTLDFKDIGKFKTTYSLN